jgi:hypothetical protein
MNMQVIAASTVHLFACLYWRVKVIIETIEIPAPAPSTNYSPVFRT